MRLASHINVVGRALTGITSRLRVLMLPGLPDKGEVSDWIQAGGTVETLWSIIEKASPWVGAEAQQAADHDRDAILDELVRLDPFAHEQRRIEKARNLHVRDDALDREITRRRTEIQNSAPMCGHWVVEPWSETVDGAALIRALISHIRCHVLCSD
jgi:hypothetical protein